MLRHNEWSLEHRNKQHKLVYNNIEKEINVSYNIQPMLKNREKVANKVIKFTQYPSVLTTLAIPNKTPQLVHLGLENVLGDKNLLLKCQKLLS